MLREPTITPEREALVARIVRETVEERFADDFVFDPIIVAPAIDEWGPDATGEFYLRIIIVFDGDQKKLDPAWTGSLIRRLRPKLNEVDVTEFPSPSWVEKSEWETMLRTWGPHNPESSSDSA